MLGTHAHNLYVRIRHTGDPWLQAVLQADRHGVESWEMYCFTHGLPTRNPGSWQPNTNRLTCGNAKCQAQCSASSEIRLSPAGLRTMRCRVFFLLRILNPEPLRLGS
jgi:hypothetical protein